MFSTRVPVACAGDWPHPDHCRCVRVVLASPQASTNDAGVSTGWRVQSCMTVRGFGAVAVVGAAVAGGGIALDVVVGSVLVDVAAVADGVAEVVATAVAWTLGVAGGAPAMLFLLLPMITPASRTAMSAKTPARIGQR